MKEECEKQVQEFLQKILAKSTMWMSCMFLKDMNGKYFITQVVQYSDQVVPKAVSNTEQKVVLEDNKKKEEYSN